MWKQGSIAGHKTERGLVDFSCYNRQMESVRRPRFKRTADIPAMVLTERDRALIDYVNQHRFVRSTHLFSLVSGSRQQLLRRLQRLYHHGYLERPPAQITYYRAGSEPIVYGLGIKGMSMMQSRDNGTGRRLYASGSDRAVTRFFIEHALAVTDAMVTLELACRKHGAAFIRVDSHRSIKWKVSIPDAGLNTNVGIVPDSIFGIKTAAEINWFCLEADRGTMPITRARLNQTSFSRKIMAYYETWKQKLLQDSFSRFRVLTVTTNTTHAENLIEATQRLTKGKGAGLFLFSDAERFVGDVLRIPVMNGRGERVYLLN